MSKKNIILFVIFVFLFTGLSYTNGYAMDEETYRVEAGYEQIKINSSSQNQVNRPTLEINWDIQLITNYKRGFIVKTNNKTGNLKLRVADESIAEAKVVDSEDSRGYYCEIVGKRAGTTKLIAEDSGTLIEKEITVSGPNLDIPWDVNLITNYKRGFIVKTNYKTGNLTLRVDDGSIAEAEVVDRNDSRGYYCEIVGKRAGSTKLIAEDSGTIIEKEVTVSGPNLDIPWDVNLITNYKRGFVVKTNNKTGNLKLRIADESIAEAKVVDSEDSRGYYCEIVGKKAGTTKLIAEDSGTIIEKEITVSDPQIRLNIDWDIQLITNYKRGFIVKTNNKTGNLKLRVADESIAEAKVVDSEDSRGYYCEIIGKRTGTTKLIAEDSGTIIEKEITVSEPKIRLNIDWDIQLITNYRRGFIVKTNNKTGNLKLRVADESIAEAKVVDSEDSRGYYCEIIGKRTGTTKLIAEDSGTIIEKEITVSGSIRGIDVSAHQEWIDWDSVKASGIEFAMIRVGYRGWGSGTIIEDKYFERNIREAKRVGLKVGVYFYSGAINTSEAIEEAQFVINKVRNYSLDYPVAFDFEDFENTESRYYKLDKNQRTDISIAFLDMVKRYGYTPMMYGNPNYFNNERYFDTSRLVTQYKVWLAHYYWADSARNQYSDFVNFLASGKKTGYSYEGKQGTIDMWQFSSEGIISGINGRVDLNISYF